MRAKRHLPLSEQSLGFFDANMQAALKLLQEAHDFAKEFRKSLWEFGLELGSLKAVGLNHSQLRWLLCQGYVQQGMETTPAQLEHRTFRPIANLKLNPESCFILTAKGIDLLKHRADNLFSPISNANLLLTFQIDPATTDPSFTLTPRWLPDYLELRLGDYLIKKFRRPAANQITILTAFEEDGWPFRIDNPLPPTRDLNDKDRLQEAIRRLNRHQQTPLLRFHGDGTGEGVTWEIAR